MTICQSEWITLRVLAQANYRDLSMKDFWKVIVSKHSSTFPEFIKLVAAILVIPVSSVDC